jgi:hypothetical protein
MRLDWIADCLRAAGLRVAEVDGWRTRGHGDMGDVLGVLCHHTGGLRQGDHPSLGVVRDGRSDLAGPLSALVLGRDGTFYVVAAGKSWHAGRGAWQGVTDGNAHFIGIEAENTGGPDDRPWPAVQIDAYVRGVAALLRHIGRDESWCVGHKEYALPKGRKDDPDFDMDAFRGRVRAALATTPPPPNQEPDMPLNDADKQFIRDTILDIVRKEGISGAADATHSGVAQEIDGRLARLEAKVDQIIAKG